MLSEKTILITGSTRGIGRTIAEKFSQQNARIVLNARNKVEAEQFAHELMNKYHIKTEVVIFDVSIYEEIVSGFKEFSKISKQLDCVINNAGVLNDALIGMVTKQQVEYTFSVNTFGVIYVSQYAARFMQKRKSGSIINISSIMGTNGNIGLTVYSGSKASVIGITKSLSKELAIDNIRVNAIAPGFIDTEMTRSLSEEKYKQRIASIGMGRIGTPEDIANTALFLASDLSKYVTGQVIGVDGGMIV